MDGWMDGFNKQIIAVIEVNIKLNNMTILYFPFTIVPTGPIWLIPSFLFSGTTQVLGRGRGACPSSS